MKIITATPDDTPRIMPCARQFCQILNERLVESYYEVQWRSQLQSGSGAMFLMEEDDGRISGGIAATLNRKMLSGDLVGVEQFWYVEPERRRGTAPMRLLNLIENWAKEAGCLSMAMIHMMDSMPEAMEGIYLRRGYRLFEKQYIKKL